MADDPVPRFLEDRSQWSADDEYRYLRHGTRPENPAWRERADEVLRRAGLESFGGASHQDTELSTEDYLQHIQGKR
jgi:hypothetical protein